MRDSFDRNLAFGQLGEGYIAQWLINRRGCYVLPIYEQQLDTGKGPVLFTEHRDLIAPDLLVFKRPEWEGSALVKKGKVLWFEAKTKSSFTWYRKHNKWTTGIDRRHYEDYLEVNALSPWPVWVLFLQLDGTAKDTPPGKISPQGLFGGTLDFLADNVNHASDNHGKSGMVYWAHDKLIQIATLEEVLNAARQRGDHD